MTRKLVVCFTCLMLLLGACAPTPTAAPANPTNPQPTAVATPQAVVSGQVSFMVFGDPAEKAAYDTLVAEFEKLYPQIDIQLIHIPGQAEYRQRLAADFSAGAPADVVLLNYRRYAPFANKNQIEPLNQYLAQSTLIKEADFYQETIAPFKWKGELMCIPQNLSSLVVYYNKNLFDQANLAYPKDDWTWGDFLATAQALTRDTNGDGAIDQYGLGTEASLFRVAPFIWQNGGELLDDPAKPTRLTIDTPEAKEALQWYVDLQVKHHVVPDAVAEEAEDSESRFISGSMGMFLNSRRGVPTYREITSFDWDVAALPQNKVRAGILHSDGYCMAALSQNKAAAWKFIEFANSPTGQTIVVASGRTVPSLRAVAESPAFLDPNARPVNSKVYLDTIPYIRGVPVLDVWVDIESMGGEELERAFYGNASLDEVIEAMITRSNDFFAKSATP